ncbi:hypothetical protein M8542_33640 [Amycolatopsis sp. OK19-0408]|uniref:Uncharacterized protein n=1 Tax=Amycolatopsis iheyensis TaxID=2945988 RepID=A0A9X2SPQ5_9PSEU|nr:hypothetical protein [Amycolatopsis iheyensis]MCR6487780.1 hypothetical protein [Amycolatopsis iheyensis]
MYPLQDGERLLWSGRPEHARRWFPEHLALLVGAIAVIGVLGTWFVLDDSFVAFVGLPLALVLLFTTTLPHLRNSRARAFATTYLVTDQRIIFVAQWPSGAEYRWVRLSRLGPPRVKADDRGVGTITFGTSPWTRWQLANKPQPGAWAPFVPDLYAIAGAARVAELISAARQPVIAR